MLLITLRDLRWRARRFVLAIAATSLVFSTTLLLFGVHAGFLAESTRTVDMFHADAWVVPAVASGPFTATAPIGVRTESRLATAPGVRAVTAVALYREVVRDSAGVRHDVNVIGYVPGSFVRPPTTSGHGPLVAGQAEANDSLGTRLGSLLRLGTVSLRVVGISHGISYYGGVPALFLTLGQMQQIAFAGAPLATALLTHGRPTHVSRRLKVMTPSAVTADLRRPLAPATTTIGILSVIMLLVAAGIVGLIAYLSGLDRLLDFAVYKAMGVRDGKLIASLVLEVLIISIGSALAGVALSNVLAPIMPVGVVLGVGAYALLFALALLVTVSVSLVSVRQATSVDPALAFGRA